jgi:kynureninase
MNELLKNYRSKAEQLDAEDPLHKYRSYFSLPKEAQAIYLCNNSLGLPAASAMNKMTEQIQNWSEFGAEGWFKDKSNWYKSFDVPLTKSLSKLLGAKYDEVIVMNSLTVNLHLLMVSFYQPTDVRYKILIDGPTFPSDLYAIKSHLLNHGLNPETDLIIAEPRAAEHLLREEDIKSIIENEGDSIALVFFSSVNFLTGQVHDMERITKLAKNKGCTVGYDLAHAAGNISLKLHEWGVDFAVGCSYKYLCSGPGGPGIAFVHEMHHEKNLPRFSGWWGNDPSTRFQMQLQDEFIPYGGAYSWQVSTPSILSMIPLIAAFEVFEEVGMDDFRKKSILQTAFLLDMLMVTESHSENLFEVITPMDPTQRGCQISLLIHQDCKECLERLEKKGVICDFRPPNVIRVTPSPFYNTFQDIYEFACRFHEALS